MKSCRVFGIATGIVMILSLVGCTAGDGEVSGVSTGVRLDYNMDVAKDGRIVFQGAGHGDSDLYIFNPATKAVRRLTDSPDFEQTPSFADSDKYVVYAASKKPGEASHIYIRAVSGGGATQLTNGSVYDHHPRVSQDGNLIVFARAARHRPYSMGGYTWDEFDIYAINRDGTNLRRITNERYRTAYDLEFCKDTRQVAYVAERTADNEWYVFKVDCSAASPTPKLVLTGSDCSCSSDGKRIAFISDKKTEFDYEVWIADQNGSSQKQVTNMSSYITNPVFTHDGKRLLFLSETKRDDRPEIWQIDVTGKNPGRVADYSLFRDPMKYGASRTGLRGRR